MADRKISPAMRDELVAALRQGVPVERAAEAVGLDARRLWDAIASGRRGHEFYRPLADALAATREEHRGAETALVERAAALIEGGSSVRAAAEALNVERGRLLALARRPYVTDARARLARAVASRARRLPKNRRAA